MESNRFTDSASEFELKIVLRLAVCEVFRFFASLFSELWPINRAMSSSSRDIQVFFYVVAESMFST